ncbi:MAG: DUF1127 domain-containing protein [Cocleimonas sp.]|nr:DUF1127 domain-containing protein [Cocleimonas sp.]
MKEEVIIMSSLCMEGKLTEGSRACGKTILNSGKCTKLLTKKWMTTVDMWVQRSRQRKQLARLDKHLLEDIGLTEEMVAKEIEKPFWK